MVLEFVFPLGEITFPKQQKLPDVFMDEAFNGNRFLYLTNTNRKRFKVGFVIKREGIAVLQGKRWVDFATDGIDPLAIMLHFIQEGDDSFYVTGYLNFGNEMCGYDAVEGRLSRYFGWVFNDRKVPQTVTAEFLHDLNVEDTIAIDVEDELYNIGVTRVEAGYGTNLFEYEFNRKHWKVIVRNQEMKGRMYVVFTKKRNNCIQLMLFNEDGTQVTTGFFLGVTSLAPNQPQLSFEEEADERLQHTCQWAYHKNHFGKKDKSAFFKWFPMITDRDRLKIPANFLNLYLMHMYERCLIRYTNIEYKMKMTMDYHWEDPDRNNNVGVHGKWKEFGRACGFAPDKMLRFKYRYNVSNSDDEDEVPFPVFEVC